ncbi:contact-dependent growth inhibition system immunity protein [Yersinia bercovieri]|uniref:DUF1436 domain-containing protein n=1 Tax=Yersinia bercovieri TaxID=634 RepID=A0A2G4U7L4_YERBE|nr:contact-dependent growth inhibition system immunity protein [Yersinia bercovieri]PHZ29230.1 DUF1436 domain-containing protein [Yersinia bercovieri]QKJ07193.1 CdiI family contact-dependent growth inhibition immunity protein [Yersinia bercovieri ATCC 43970]CNE60361.1 Protein of uncharacterised function (DUF1436) [Yersinia bercovieri]
MFNKDQDYWISVFSTKEFLCIDTYSGLGRVRRDPLFPSCLLPADAGDKSIGDAVLFALSNSRTLTSLEERVAFFDLEKGKEQYAAWVAMLMGRFGYKTKRALFKDMKSCHIHCINDWIRISPTHHEKLEAWSGKGIKGADDVLISVDSEPEEIGAALRLAISRCTG